MEMNRREEGLAFAAGVTGWVRGIFFFLGLFMFAVTGGALWKFWTLYSGGQTALGRVARFHEAQSGNSDSAGARESLREHTLYYPVIRFEAEGKTWEFTSSHGGRGHAYRDGQEVEVVYTPGAPQKAEIARSIMAFSGLWAAAAGFFIAGLVFMLVSRLLPRLLARFGLPPRPQ